MRKLIKTNRVNSIGYKREKKTWYRKNESKIGESREVILYRNKVCRKAVLQVWT